MLNTPKSQRGMTAIGMAMVLALCAFVLFIVVKLTPAYLAGFKISAALEGLTSDARVEGASDAEVKKLLMTKFQIDDIDDYVNRDDIKIEHGRGSRKVSINYESRIHMMGNVDAVVNFSNEAVNIKY
jgi:hypothetical protein